MKNKTAGRRLERRICGAQRLLHVWRLLEGWHNLFSPLVPQNTNVISRPNIYNMGRNMIIGSQGLISLIVGAQFNVGINNTSAILGGRMRINMKLR